MRISSTRSRNIAVNTIPHTEYTLVEAEQIPLVTKQQIRKYHSRSELLDFLNFIWGQRQVHTPNGDLAFYAWDYERWIKQKENTYT